MKPKADLKLVILCLRTPVYFLEGQANVELVLRIMQSTMVYNPMGSTKLCREGKRWTGEHQYHTKPLLRYQAGSRLGTTMICLVNHTLAMVVAFNQKSEFCLIPMDLVELTALSADDNLGMPLLLLNASLVVSPWRRIFYREDYHLTLKAKAQALLLLKDGTFPPCTLYFLYL